MEHESDPSPDQDPGKDSISWVGVIVKLIVGIIVLFFVAVAFVYGACLLG